MTRRVFRAQLALLGLAVLFLVPPTLFAQESAQSSPELAPATGIPEDWSMHHIIYTGNGSIEDMMKVRNDPRFLNAMLMRDLRQRRSQAAAHSLDEDQSSRNGMIEDAFTIPTPRPEFPELWRYPSPAPPPRNVRTKIDWAVSLGANFGMAIGESPAKYSFNPYATPQCPTTTPPSVGDFVVYSLKATPKTGSQANLVGLNNLYTNSAGTGYCTGTGPSFLFSYAIGSGGSLLSPVLSLNGSKVAWIENTSAGHAVLHITTWVSGQGANATTGAVAIGSGGSSDVALDYTSKAYTGCVASTDTNTNSEIYVDYPSGNAFVGADNGILYHVSGIFGTTPTVDFCIDVNTSAGIALSGGIYDSRLSPPELFISDSKKLYAYTVGTSSFTLVTSYTYGNGVLTGPGPVLDAFNNFLYAFSADDLADHTSVTQISTTLSSSTASVAPLGPASTNSWAVLFYGAFDNTYLNTGPANSASTLYSCGTDPTTTTAQDLYALNFNSTSGVMNTTAVMGANTHVNPGGKNGTCSPITEFDDGTTDRIFVGMGQHSATTGANTVQMWNVTSQLNSTSDTYTAQAANYAGGSSGIIIDNNASPTNYPQAESIYFTTLSAGATFTTCGANNYCAVKLTQSALQ